MGYADGSVSNRRIARKVFRVSELPKVVSGKKETIEKVRQKKTDAIDNRSARI